MRVFVVVLLVAQLALLAYVIALVHQARRLVLDAEEDRRLLFALVDDARVPWPREKTWPAERWAKRDRVRLPWTAAGAQLLDHLRRIGGA